MHNTRIFSFAYSSYSIDKGPDCSFYSLEGRMVSLLDIGSQVGKGIIITASAVAFSVVKTIQSVGLLVLSVKNGKKGLKKSFKTIHIAFHSLSLGIQSGVLHRITAILGNILGFVVHPKIGQRTRQEIDVLTSKVSEVALPLAAALLSTAIFINKPRLIIISPQLALLPIGGLFWTVSQLFTALTTSNQSYKGSVFSLYKSLSGLEAQIQREETLFYMNSLADLSASEDEKRESALSLLNLSTQSTEEEVREAFKNFKNLDDIEFMLYSKAHEILLGEPLEANNRSLWERVHLELLQDPRHSVKTLALVSIFGEEVYIKALDVYQQGYVGSISNALFAENPITVDRYKGALVLLDIFKTNLKSQRNIELNNLAEIYSYLTRWALICGDREAQLAAAKREIKGCDGDCSTKKRHELALNALKAKTMTLQSLMAIEILLQDAPEEKLQLLYDYFNDSFPINFRAEILKFIEWDKNEYTNWHPSSMTLTLHKAFELLEPKLAWNEGAWENNFYPHIRKYLALRALGFTKPVSSSEIKKRYREFLLTQHSDKGNANNTFAVQNCVKTHAKDHLLSTKPLETHQDLLDFQIRIKTLKEMIEKLETISDENFWEDPILANRLYGLGLFQGDLKTVKKTLKSELSDLEKGKEPRFTQIKEVYKRLLPLMRQHAENLAPLITQCEKELDFLQNPKEFHEQGYFYKTPSEALFQNHLLSGLRMDQSKELIFVSNELVEKATGNLKTSLALLKEARSSSTSVALQWKPEWHAEQVHQRQLAALVSTRF